MRLGAPLMEVGGGMAGTLEVFHAGAWGSVCVRQLTPSQRILTCHVLFTGNAAYAHWLRCHRLYFLGCVL